MARRPGDGRLAAFPDRRSTAPDLRSLPSRSSPGSFRASIGGGSGDEDGAALHVRSPVADLFAADGDRGWSADRHWCAAHRTARLARVAENQHYQLLSESNRVQLIIVPPRRGWIVDRNNKPIAINRSDFRVDIIPDQLENPEATIRTLQQLLELSVDDVDRVVRELKQAQGLPTDRSRRKRPLREICGGDGAASGASGREPDARLLPLLPGRRRRSATSSAMSERHRQRNMRRRRTRYSSLPVSRSARKVLKKRLNRDCAASQADNVSS